MKAGNSVSERRTYTVQGWLKEISALDSSRDTLFRETMRYWDNPEIAGAAGRRSRFPVRCSNI